MSGSASRRPDLGAPPKIVIAIAIVGLSVFVVLPLVSLISRASWGTIPRDLLHPAVLNALALSLVCSLAATALSILIGLPVAWVLARATFPGRRVVRTLALLPLVLPPVVGGVALLFAFGRRGLVGQWLDAAFGWRLPFTTAGAVMAATFVAMPFLVLTVESALRSTDRNHEEVAATLGAGPITTFTHVTLRLIGPAIATGAALTWARALGEFGATITFAGNVPGRTQTLPLAVYVALETRPQAAIALSLLLIAVSVVVLVVAGKRAWSITEVGS
ncbi:MAG: ABC transporter permease [Actinomycetota bacterium]